MRTLFRACDADCADLKVVDVNTGDEVMDVYQADTEHNTLLMFERTADGKVSVTDWKSGNLGNKTRMIRLNLRTCEFDVISKATGLALAESRFPVAVVHGESFEPSDAEINEWFDTVESKT